MNGRNKSETMYPEKEAAGYAVSPVRRSWRPLLRNCGARSRRRAVSCFDLLSEGAAQQPNIGGQDEFVESELDHFRHLACCDRPPTRLRLLGNGRMRSRATLAARIHSEGACDRRSSDAVRFRRRSLFRGLAGTARPLIFAATHCDGPAEDDGDRRGDREIGGDPNQIDHGPSSWRHG